MIDYVKREDVLQILSQRNASWNGYANVMLLPSEDVIERKKGMWVETSSRNGNYLINTCSCCGLGKIIKTNYCPNCGAEMKDAQNKI